MTKQKLKGKAQKSKGKSEEARIKFDVAREDDSRESADTLVLPTSALRALALSEAHGAESKWPALLPFALCLLTFTFAFSLLPAVLHAQGCAMCYTSASAARSTAKAALANGTLILLLPPMLFFVLIAVVVYRYRNKFRESASWQPEHDRELQELLVRLPPATGIPEIGRSGDRMIR